MFLRKKSTSAAEAAALLDTAFDWTPEVATGVAGCPSLRRTGGDALAPLVAVGAFTRSSG